MLRTFVLILRANVPVPRPGPPTPSEQQGGAAQGCHQTEPAPRERPGVRDGGTPSHEKKAPLTPYIPLSKTNEVPFQTENSASRSFE